MLYQLYSEGNLTGEPIDPMAATEPNLEVGEQLYLDGVLIDYPVTTFDLRPAKDVAIDDLGFGAVRVVWPELQTSGTLVIQLEDIPADALPAIESLLLQQKPRRWLSYRGRKYQVDRIDYSYQRDARRLEDYYVLTLELGVYRPYKSLPPIPGTRIWPIMHIKRFNAEVDDVLLGVGYVYPLMGIVHTGGLGIWNTETGKRYSLSLDVQKFLAFGKQYGLDVEDSRYVFLFVNQQGKLSVAYFSNNRFEDTVYTTTYSPGPYAVINGDVALFDDAAGNQVYAYQFSTNTVSVHASGVRLNKFSKPRYLATSQAPGAVYPTDANTLWAAELSDDRMLVAKSDGLYIYEVTKENVVSGTTSGSGYLLGNVIETVESGVAIEEAGIFGAPPLVEGYWYISTPTQQTVKWLPKNYLKASSSFESDLFGWTTQNNGQIDRVHIPGLDLPGGGNYVMKVTADPASSWSGAVNRDVAGEYTPLEKGQVYTFIARIYVPSGVTLGGKWEFHRQVRGRDTTVHGYDILAGDYVWDDSIPRDTWVTKWIVIQVHDASYTWLTEPRGILFVVSQASSGAGGYVYVDAVEIRKGDWSSSLSVFGTTAGTDADGDGWTESTELLYNNKIVSTLSDRAVQWGNLRGIASDGLAYFPYNDRLIFRVEPLL